MAQSTSRRGCIVVSVVLVVLSVTVATLAGGVERIEQAVIRAIVPDRITLADTKLTALDERHFVMLDAEGNIHLFRLEDGRLRLADSGRLTEKNAEPPREILRLQHRQIWP